MWQRGPVISGRKAIISGSKRACQSGMRVHRGTPLHAVVRILRTKMARLRRALTWLQLAVLGQGGGGQKDGADGRPHCYPRSESGPQLV
jgi:hypothetical protein